MENIEHRMIERKYEGMYKFLNDVRFVNCSLQYWGTVDKIAGDFRNCATHIIQGEIKSEFSVFSFRNADQAKAYVKANPDFEYDDVMTSKDSSLREA